MCEGKTLNGEERASAPSIGGSIRTQMCKPRIRAGAHRAAGLCTVLTAASVPTTQAGSGPKCLFMVVVPACVVWGFFIIIQNAIMVTRIPLDTWKWNLAKESANCSIRPSIMFFLLGGFFFFFFPTKILWGNPKYYFFSRLLSPISFTDAPFEFSQYKPQVWYLSGR